MSLKPAHAALWATFGPWLFKIKQRIKKKRKRSPFPCPSTLGQGLGKVWNEFCFDVIHRPHPAQLPYTYSSGWGHFAFLVPRGISVRDFRAGLLMCWFVFCLSGSDTLSSCKPCKLFWAWLEILVDRDMSLRVCVTFWKNFDGCANSQNRPRILSCTKPVLYIKNVTFPKHTRKLRVSIQCLLLLCFWSCLVWVNIFYFCEMGIAQQGSVNYVHIGTFSLPGLHIHNYVFPVISKEQSHTWGGIVKKRVLLLKSQ